MKKKVFFLLLLTFGLLYLMARNIYACDPEGGQVCGPVKCCAVGPYAGDPCSAPYRTCTNGVDPECTTAENCPNNGQPDQCGNWHNCVVAKACRNGRCEYDCIGDCSPNPSTPTPTPSGVPTPTPPGGTGTIEVHKVVMPGNLQCAAPAGSQIVKRNNSFASAVCPIYYSAIPSGNSTISVTVPVNYRVTSTLCNNNVLNCHTEQCAAGTCPAYPSSYGIGNSRTIWLPTNGNLELWFHFYPICNPFWLPWSTCLGSPAQMTRYNGCGEKQTQLCYGKINVLAVQVNHSDTTCTALDAASNIIVGTDFGFTAGSASQPPHITQAAGLYAVFNSIVGGNYTLNATPPNSNYVLANSCWKQRDNIPKNVNQQSMTALLSSPLDQDAITWRVGYTLGSSWAQTQGGNVYAGNIKSYVPGVQVFSTDGPPVGSYSFPGAVVYGAAGGYDFDSSAASQGETKVSSKNWLANQSHSSAADYYQLFYNRFGAPTTPNLPNGYSQVALDKPPVPANGAYYIDGDVTTNGNWSVGATEKLVIIINGSLTIKGAINITPGGFIAFIVKNNISVDPGVGGLYTSSAPVVEGVYVTSPAGTFSTGGSTVAGRERLVGKGMFIAGSFLLQRDLDGISQNTTSAELFIYNPQLLVTMPDLMKDVPVSWQEVAP